MVDHLVKKTSMPIHSHRSHDSNIYNRMNMSFILVAHSTLVVQHDEMGRSGYLRVCKRLLFCKPCKAPLPNGPESATCQWHSVA